MTTSTNGSGRRKEPKLSPREELLELLLVERHTPIPPHRVRPVDPGRCLGTDSPGAIDERLRWLQTLHQPYEPDMESQ